MIQYIRIVTRGCLIGRRHEAHHELVLAVESNLEYLFPVTAQLQNRAETFRQSKDSLVCRVTVDLSFSDGKIHGSRIEFTRIAKAAEYANLIDDFRTLNRRRSDFLLGLYLCHQVARSFGGVFLTGGVYVCDDHFVLGQGACLIRADDRDRAKSLDSLEGLAQNLVLAHDIGDNGERCCKRNRQTLGNEGDSCRDAADD